LTKLIWLKFYKLKKVEYTKNLQIIVYLFCICDQKTVYLCFSKECVYSKQYYFTLDKYFCFLLASPVFAHKYDSITAFLAWWAGVGELNAAEYQHGASLCVYYFWRVSILYIYICIDFQSIFRLADSHRRNIIFSIGILIALNLCCFCCYWCCSNRSCKIIIALQINLAIKNYKSLC
jgi:hypothetical protein